MSATSRQLGQFGAARIAERAWTIVARHALAAGRARAVDADTVDLQALEVALTPDLRATAEDRGVEVIEGARARRCRVAVDGHIFEAAFPQIAWLVGGADLHRWRGQLDYWVFLDGQLGQVAGSINGEAAEIIPDALNGTVEVRLTATERGRDIVHLSSDPMTLDDDRGRYATKRDRLARLTRLVSILQAHPEGMRTADIADPRRDVRADRLPRPDARSRTSCGSRSGARTASGGSTTRRPSCRRSS